MVKYHITQKDLVTEVLRIGFIYKPIMMSSLKYERRTRVELKDNKSS